MKKLSGVIPGIWLGLMVLHSTISSAQSGAPPTSAKEAAQYDAQSIAGNIADIKDILFFSQNAMERAGDTRTKETAQGMFTDYTTILYSMEQLASAGSGSSSNNSRKTEKREGIFKETAALNGKLSGLRGVDYDTLWVSGLLVMQQSKYDELSQQKANATNSQLKMAVTEAIPVIRRYITQLKSLQKSLVKMLLQVKKEASRKHGR